MYYVLLVYVSCIYRRCTTPGVVYWERWGALAKHERLELALLPHTRMLVLPFWFSNTHTHTHRHKLDAKNCSSLTLKLIDILDIEGCVLVLLLQVSCLLWSYLQPWGLWGDTVITRERRHSNDRCLIIVQPLKHLPPFVDGTQGSVADML